MMLLSKWFLSILCVLLRGVNGFAKVSSEYVSIGEAESLLLTTLVTGKHISCLLMNLN